MGHVTWPRPFHRQFVICGLELAMFKPHTKYEVFTITCNEEMKGNAKCKHSYFEPPFGDLGVTHGIHLWLDVKRIVDFILAIVQFLASCYGCGTIKRNLSKSAFSEGVDHFERKF